MIKLLALYKKPADLDAFMKHYEEVHIPLVKKIPGLAKAVINKAIGAPMGGEPAYFMIAEMHFADKPTFDAAMASPENRAAGKDIMSFAKDLATLMVVED